MRFRPTEASDERNAAIFASWLWAAFPGDRQISKTSASPFRSRIGLAPIGGVAPTEAERTCGFKAKRRGPVPRADGVNIYRTDPANGASRLSRGTNACHRYAIKSIAILFYRPYPRVVSRSNYLARSTYLKILLCTYLLNNSQPRFLTAPWRLYLGMGKLASAR